MKKIYAMTRLGCANCAAKMEDAINKIEGVNSATISFILQKMTIDVQEDQLDDIMGQIVKVCKKIEPRCTIVR